MSNTCIRFISPGADTPLVEAILATRGHIENDQKRVKDETGIRTLLNDLKGHPIQIDIADGSAPMSRVISITAVVADFSPIFVACWPSHTEVTCNQRIEGGYLVRTDDWTSRLIFPWREGEPDLTIESLVIAGMDEKEAQILLARLDAAPGHHLVTEDRVTGLVPDHEMEYEEWLEWSGLDDSFVGNTTMGIPGTYDVYEAAMEQTREPKEIPSP